jgi:hypothetical protein
MNKRLLIAALVWLLPIAAFAQTPVNTELPAATAASDNMANPTAPFVLSAAMCWDGTFWDRCTGAAADTELPTAAAAADNMANPTAPFVLTANMCWDGATWDRCPGSTGGAGTVDANTNRTVEATDSQLSAGVGATADAAVAVGAAGSITAKLRLMTTQLDAIQTAVQTNPGYLGASATTTNSAVECAIISAASTNATNCKASAGNFYGLDIYNTTTTVYYLRLYNLAAAPTCSSATGFIRSIPIPPAAAAGGVGGIVRVLPVGVGYATGISFCLTGGSSSTDNTNAATGVFGAVLYK